MLGILPDCCWVEVMVMMSWSWSEVMRSWVMVMRREEGHLFKMALYFEVEGQRKKGRSKEERKDEEDMEKAG